MSRALLLAVAAASLASAGCEDGNGPSGTPSTGPRDAPAPAAKAAAPDELPLVPLPAAAVAVCRRAQALARFTVLCPARLPRATRAFTPGTPPLPLVVSRGRGVLDFSYSAPAAPEGSVPVRLNSPERFLHFVVGRALEGVPPGSRAARLGGRRGLLARATPDGALDSSPYWGNHLRFLWREHRTRYVATLHTFGAGATERLLDRLMRELRPARSLSAAATMPGREAAIFTRPADLTVGFGAVWVGAMANEPVGDPSLLRVDPATLRVRPHASAQPIDVHVAAGAEGLWMTGAARPSGSRLIALQARRIDPKSGRVIESARLTRFRAGELVVGDVAAGDDAIWVSANRFRWRGTRPHASGTVWRLDPASGRITAGARVPAGAAALLAADGAVWAAGVDMPVISRLDARTGALTGSVRVGPRPYGLAYADGAIWVTDNDDGTVRRIDPRTQRVTATVYVGRAPHGIAGAPRGIWVATLGDGAIARVDPAARRVTQRIHTGGDPVAVAVADGHVWTVLNSDGALLRLAP